MGKHTPGQKIIDGLNDALAHMAGAPNRAREAVIITSNGGCASIHAKPREPDMTRKELKELCERATPGPWSTAFGDSIVSVLRPDGGELLATMTKRYWEKYDDEDAATAAFVAASRTAIPALIEQVEMLRAALESALQPKPDEHPHDGPCCYRLQKACNGNERWFSTGCDCGNSDDAQSAGEWASDMNRWIEQAEARAALDATKE